LAAENLAAGVSLTWTASFTEDIDGYAVYRSGEEGGDFEEVGKTTLETVTYLDESAREGITYYYYVTAYKTAADDLVVSTRSDTISLTRTTPTSEQEGFSFLGLGFLQLALVGLVSLVVLVPLGYFVYKRVLPNKGGNQKSPPEPA
jgi:hypothetical protein